jgi:hypothetical protein
MSLWLFVTEENDTGLSVASWLQAYSGLGLPGCYGGMGQNHPIPESW